MKTINVKWLLPMLLIGLLLQACDEDDSEGREPVEYHITIGDTAITIPDSAVVFAGLRLNPAAFNWNAYMLREYQVATTMHTPPYGGTLTEWKETHWSIRSTFLTEPYTRDFRIDDDAFYYYMIGTYKDQFGYGWRDTFDPEADLWDPASNPWTHPADTTLIPDSTHTIAFDGETKLMEQYRNMWVIEL